MSHSWPIMRDYCPQPRLSSLFVPICWRLSFLLMSWGYLSEPQLISAKVNRVTLNSYIVIHHQPRSSAQMQVGSTRASRSTLTPLRNVTFTKGILLTKWCCTSGQQLLSQVQLFPVHGPCYPRTRIRARVMFTLLIKLVQIFVFLYLKKYLESHF